MNSAKIEMHPLASSSTTIMEKLLWTTLMKEMMLVEPMMSTTPLILENWFTTIIFGSQLLIRQNLN
jgi:hypothetical protein